MAVLSRYCLDGSKQNVGVHTQRCMCAETCTTATTAHRLYSLSGATLINTQTIRSHSICLPSVFVIPLVLVRPVLRLFTTFS